MAKLIYGPAHGTITVTDSKTVPKGDFEITAEQALALSTFQISNVLSNIVAALKDMSPRTAGKP